MIPLSQLFVVSETLLGIGLRYNLIHLWVLAIGLARLGKHSLSDGSSHGACAGLPRRLPDV